jgi:glycosyltransferase involved in cell wall biosynthesis
MHASYPFRRKALGWALRRAAGVITVSNALRDFALSMGVAPERVRVIPNGVDTSVFYPRPRSRPSEAAKVILSAGYLIERKGHHHVIRAAARLRKRGVSCELWIAGGPGREGQFEERLRSLTAELKMEDSVRFLGAVPPARLAELMSQADVFCLASSREGWPNVVNEALACGTPVVATRIGGVPELLPSPEYGMIVEPGDPQGLEAALETSLSREWDRVEIARWGQSRSWDQVAREVADFLEQAIKRR